MKLIPVQDIKGIQISGKGVWQSKKASQNKKLKCRETTDRDSERQSFCKDLG